MVFYLFEFVYDDLSPMVIDRKELGIIVQNHCSPVFIWYNIVHR